MNALKKTAVIDPYVVSPSINCFNHLVSSIPAQFTYHWPHKMGFESLKACEFDAIIVLGSASNITDAEPWHKELAEFLAEKLKNNIPVLGLCFGHQLLCHYLGAKIDFIEKSQIKLKGSRQVKITKPIFDFKVGDTFELAISHQQMVISLSEDFEEIGYGLKNDIVKHKKLPFIGLQPHPEASLHFCQTESEITDQEQLKLVQKDGIKFIKSWINQIK